MGEIWLCFNIEIWRWFNVLIWRFFFSTLCLDVERTLKKGCFPTLKSKMLFQCCKIVVQRRNLKSTLKQRWKTLCASRVRIPEQSDCWWDVFKRITQSCHIFIYNFNMGQYGVFDCSKLCPISWQLFFLQKWFWYITLILIVKKVNSGLSRRLMWLLIILCHSNIYIYFNYTPLNRHRSVQAFLSSELPDTGDEYWIGYTHVNGHPPSWSSGADVGFTNIEAKGNYHTYSTYWIGYTHVDVQSPSWSSGADVGFTYIEAKGN